MPNLYPASHDAAILTAEEVDSGSPVGYRNGIAFDDELGDFKRDGKYKILDNDGIESWKSWCVNCLSTERYAHLAYSSDFGIDTTSAFMATSRKEAESILSREITEALLADPYGRTAYVEEISFDWEAPDSVAVSLTVQGIDTVTIDLTAYINKRGT